MSKRLYKKRYKAAITRISDKILAAFSDKKDRKRWISLVTNMMMQAMKEGKHA